LGQVDFERVFEVQSRIPVQPVQFTGDIQLTGLSIVSPGKNAGTVVDKGFVIEQLEQQSSCCMQVYPMPLST